jgi:hypothetical protein
LTTPHGEFQPIDIAAFHLLHPLQLTHVLHCRKWQREAVLLVDEIGLDSLVVEDFGLVGVDHPIAHQSPEEFA